MARTFNGDTANRLERNEAIVTAAALTLACWFYREGDGTDTRCMLAVGQSGTQNAFELVWRGTGGDTIAAIALDGAIARSEIAEPALNEWHHAAAVFTSTTSRLIYLDGNAGTENTTSITPAGLNTTWVGVVNEGSLSNPWQGRLAEVAIWNVALSGSDIASLAGGARPDTIQAGNLKAYWPLCGSASPEPDLSGNGDDLTVVGSLGSAAHPSGVSSPCRRWLLVR